MNSAGFAISEYHDTRDIYSKLDHLLGQPIRPIKREEIDKYKKYFDTQCSRSQQLFSGIANQSFYFIDFHNI